MSVSICVMIHEIRNLSETNMVLLTVVNIDFKILSFLKKIFIQLLASVKYLFLVRWKMFLGGWEAKLLPGCFLGELTGLWPACQPSEWV